MSRGNLHFMKVYVSFKSDHIDQIIGRASLADKPEEVARIAQATEHGNAIWRSWSESHGGQVINLDGAEGRLYVEADHLEELPKIREQYEGAIGSSVSVGVGTRLSEADKSLKAAKLQGGDRIQLYTEEVNEILAELKDKEEDEKSYDEYMDPESGIQKAQPSMNAGEHAGFAGASQSHPVAPQKPTEGSEHSEAEVARSQIENAPAFPQAATPTVQDYEQLFHQLAAQQPQEIAQKPTGLADDARAQVVKILQDVRGHAQELEQMKGSNPALYESVKGLVQAMIAMARGQAGGEEVQTPKQELDKAALDPGKTGRHQVILPVGSQIDPGPSANHEGGEIKIRDPETNKTKWRQVRSGLVMAPDGTPTSSRNPGG